MSEKINFTKATLAAVTVPAGADRTYVYDLKTPGLTFCLTANGAQSFYLYRRVKGRPERIRLGGFPELTIEQARDEAAKANGDIAKGIDPQAAKKSFRAQWTLGELFTWYLEAHAKVHKKSWKQDEDQFDRYLDAWRNRKLSSINRGDVQALHAKIGKDHGPYSANRLLALLHTLYERAVDVGWKDGNPARKIKKFNEESRERFLQVDELQAFFAAMKQEPNETLQDFFWMSLLTGARRGNVMAMKWEDVSLPRSTWTIPAKDAKAKNVIAVPLVPKAAEILTRRKEAANDSPFVFPSYGKSGHLEEPKMAWARLLKRANIKDLRLHDLRRTLGSWQAAAGTSLPIIGKSLGHKNTATTAVYARLNIDPVRISVTSATAALMAGGEPLALPMIADARPTNTIREGSD